MKILVHEKKQLSDKERLFIETQNNCALCNSILDLTVTKSEDIGIISPIDEVLEEATCPSCNIKTRVKNHSVQ